MWVGSRAAEWSCSITAHRAPAPFRLLLWSVADGRRYDGLK